VTLPQAFELAVRHHQCGRLAEAEALYRQILAVEPQHAAALHLLGVIAHQLGRHEVAVNLIAQAIGFAPSVPEFHCNLGEAYRALGRFEEAIAEYRLAIVLKSDLPEAYYNLANALKAQGRLEEAAAAYHRALALRPNYPEACSNLGVVFSDKGQFEEAISAFRQALALNRNYADAHSNLGVALKKAGRLEEALDAFREAIALKPNLPEAHNNLGNVLREKGRSSEAIVAYRQAIILKPNDAEAYSNLGVALSDIGELPQAVAAYRQAIALKPDHAEAHSNLGNALTKLGMLDEAVTVLREAIALRPGHAGAHNNLGSVLLAQGRVNEAIAELRRAVELQPDLAEAHSGTINCLHHQPGVEAQSIFRESSRWNEIHARPLRGSAQPYPNGSDPERRLRVGYVSAHFRHHAIGRALMPLLREHDHERFEIFCFAGVSAPDDPTRQFQGYADQWHSLVGLTEQEAADLIRREQIDILVDVEQHTAHHHLLVFARKPAPVQVSYIGYPASTGLETVDYRISDRYLEGGSAVEAYGTRERVCLIDSFWCYDAPGIDIPVSPLPALEGGAVTFGCLNNFTKINDAVLALWARVLQRVEGSKLMMLSPAGSHREATVERFQQLGVAPARVEFFERKPVGEYLRLYHQIDIGLDTFPYNGHTTSLDAFWMGVPVLGLVGGLPVARAGLSNLMNLGLPELVVTTEDDYVRLAAELAGDLPRLAQIRATLRKRMESSVLMDAPRYARQVEEAYQMMWRRWCAG
jgi:predicted O-linked N-acetylglucosamine transferase (SPINDLY family)